MKKRGCPLEIRGALGFRAGIADGLCASNVPKPEVAAALAVLEV